LRKVSGDHLNRGVQFGGSLDGISSQHADRMTSFVQQPRDQAPGTLRAANNQDAVLFDLVHRASFFELWAQAFSERCFPSRSENGSTAAMFRLLSRSAWDGLAGGVIRCILSSSRAGDGGLRFANEPALRTDIRGRTADD
jgi:hypothetical protein